MGWERRQRAGRTTTAPFASAGSPGGCTWAAAGAGGCTSCSTGPTGPSGGGRKRPAAGGGVARPPSGRRPRTRQAGPPPAVPPDPGPARLRALAARAAAGDEVARAAADELAGPGGWAAVEAAARVAVRRAARARAGRNHRHARWLVRFAVAWAARRAGPDATTAEAAVALVAAAALVADTARAGTGRRVAAASRLLARVRAASVQATGGSDRGDVSRPGRPADSRRPAVRSGRHTGGRCCAGRSPTRVGAGTSPGSASAFTGRLTDRCRPAVRAAPGGRPGAVRPRRSLAPRCRPGCDRRPAIPSYRAVSHPYLLAACSPAPSRTAGRSASGEGGHRP
jgi:hypothetical protein